MNEEREVEIYGSRYRVKGDDPDRIQTAAALLDRVMRELLGDPSRGLSTREAVLAALNIADQRQVKEQETERILNEIEKRMDELLELLPG